MLKIVVLLFALAALGGLALATLRFREKNVPWPLAILHLILAAAGLITFIVSLIQTGVAGLLGLALALFVVAALGGFVMLVLHLKERPLPKPLIVVHGLLAVAAFILLVTYMPWGV